MQEDLFEIANWLHNASLREGIATLINSSIDKTMTLYVYKRARFLSITAIMGFFASKGEADLFTVCEGGRAVDR